VGTAENSPSAATLTDSNNVRESRDSSWWWRDVFLVIARPKFKTQLGATTVHAPPIELHFVRVSMRIKPKRGGWYPAKKFGSMR
jgi:hypothetical protein